MEFSFRNLGPSDVSVVLNWLKKPHIQEFWDNSKEHHDDIKHFAERRKIRTYHDGIYSYWLGTIYNDVFCMIMTSRIESDSYIHKDYILQDQITYSLDFCIGNKTYLGQGLAAPVLKEFIEYFKKNIDPRVGAFFIDPHRSNPRAKHVYQKAGFKIVGEFVRESGFFTGQLHDLLIIKI